MYQHGPKNGLFSYSRHNNYLATRLRDVHHFRRELFSQKNSHSKCLLENTFRKVLTEILKRLNEIRSVPLANQENCQYLTHHIPKKKILRFFVVNFCGGLVHVKVEYM